MNSRNPPSQILIPNPRDHKPSFLNHPPELVLAGEALNAFHKILITATVPSNQLADERDSAKIPALINRIEDRVIDLTELHAREHTAGLQHTEGLGQRSLLIGEIADTKDDGVQIDRVVGDMRHVLGVGLDEGEAVGVIVGGLGGALAAFGKHVGVDVADGDASLEVVVDVGGVVEHAEGDVAGPAGDVEDVPAFLAVVVDADGEGGAWVQRSHEVVFP